MYALTKNISKLFLLSSLLFSSIVASDFITLTTPVDGSTVSGSPLEVNGTSSQANAQVQFIFDGVDIGNIVTDGSGNFAISFGGIENAVYTITLNLLAPDNTTVLATTTSTFAVVNPPTIAITNPFEGAEIFFNPITVSGVSSVASATVNISVDGVFTATTTTDSSGNWSAPFSFASNGNHTILAELVVSGTTVASNSITVLATIIQRIIQGVVPTTGSGSGPGFTYSVSGSVVTITADNAFTFAPIALATGQRSSGDSTVTIISTSNTELNIRFSLGTESVYFLFAAIS